MQQCSTRRYPRKGKLVGWGTYIKFKMGGETYRGRATHELSELIRDLGGVQNLLLTPTIAELRIRIVNRVFVVLGSCTSQSLKLNSVHQIQTTRTNLRQVLNPSPILVKIFLRPIREHPWSHGSMINSQPVYLNLLIPLTKQRRGGGTIWETGPETARIHAFESEGEGTGSNGGLDRIVGKVKCGGAS